MQPLFIESTKHTPTIHADIDKGLITIKGSSYPEDATDTYQQVFDYIMHNQDKISQMKCELEMEFLNSNSQKLVFNLLLILQNLFDDGKKIEVVWKYEENDEDMREMGEDIKQLIYVPMVIVQA
ncbi:MAG TPA: hypothetical protein DCQ31_04250 [Bacteroidales bacterium]|nr:hypothetical protein [Bacteroidales bacterium]